MSDAVVPVAAHGTIRALTILRATLDAIEDPERWCSYQVRDGCGHVVDDGGGPSVVSRSTADWLSFHAGYRKTRPYLMAYNAVLTASVAARSVGVRTLDYRWGREESVKVVRAAIAGLEKTKP